MIAFRRRHPVLSQEEFYRPEDLSWFSASGWMPEWELDGALGCRLHDAAGSDRELCMLFNPAVHAVNFVLPHAPAGQVWRKAVDTGASSPFDVCEPDGEVPLFEQTSLLVWERSLVVLVAGPDPRLL